MKNSLKSLMLLFLFAASSAIVFSQNRSDLKIDSVSPPAEEKFQASADLVSPWRSSGCNPLADKEFRELNCYQVSDADWRKSDVLTLYNADGTIWYRFSLTYDSAIHFLKNTKSGFLPFSTPYADDHIVLLRMVSESSNWYEVEVNEKTRATKFVSKNDAMWATTKWSYWIFESLFLKFGDTQKLLDKPDGEVIKESSDFIFDKVKVLKVEGDWAYVRNVAQPKEYYGWIRWRKGRNILVGCLYNDNKVPEAPIDFDN
jgi:hypothetical protein